MLYAPDATDISLALKLELLCINDEAEYKAMIIYFKNGSPKAPSEKGIRNLSSIKSTVNLH